MSRLLPLLALTVSALAAAGPGARAADFGGPYPPPAYDAPAPRPPEFGPRGFERPEYRGPEHRGAELGRPAFGPPGPVPHPGPFAEGGLAERPWGACRVFLRRRPGPFGDEVRRVRVCDEGATRRHHHPRWFGEDRPPRPFLGDYAGPDRAPPRGHRFEIGLDDD